MAAQTPPAMRFTNRELSWTAFNKRVLMEAANDDNPIFEKLKFLSIVSTNLDEFFMVRVASVRDQVQAGYKGVDPSGLKPREQLDALAGEIRRMVNRQYKILSDRILPELAKERVFFIPPESLTREQAVWLEAYFDREVFPVLTPMRVDDAHHFPLILSRSLNILATLASKAGKKSDLATVQVPTILPRVVVLPASQGEKPMLLMETVILEFIDKLFPGRSVLETCPYRITRNADLTFDEEEAGDLLIEIQKSLKKRKWGSVIRLEVQKDAPGSLVSFLKNALTVADSEIYRVDGPINLDFFMKQVYGFEGYDHLKYKPFTPKIDTVLNNGPILDAVKKQDFYFYHPYDSFDPVIRFIREAAEDPDVLAIKQTLYRVSGQSPVVGALALAAQNGKQVTVLLEVKARFDEENNIHWGQELEKAGCHVMYGMKGLKTHSKITLIVRREEGEVARYTHLGTGNYNDVTARLYTDMGILTANPVIGQDASDFFNVLTTKGTMPRMKLLTAAPTQLRGEFMRLIHREREHALRGRPAKIRAKMNALVDPGLIEALYQAGAAGVKIELIIRGICCLRPGVKGLSENITVRSIVGRFLEHPRVYHFANGGAPELYLSSADWMPRNLDKRVELMFPVLDSAISFSIMATMDLQWRDTQKAWELKPNQSYERRCRKSGDPALNAQEEELKERRET